MSNKSKLRLVRPTDRDEIPPHEWIVRKLESIGEVSPDDRQELQNLPGVLKHLRAYEDLVREGDRPDHVCLVISGLVCRYKLVSDGERQIMSFHVPGDIPDTLSLFMGRMDHSLGTLTESTVLRISHATMLDLFERRPPIAHLFWRATLIEAAVFREWMLGLGRLDAYSRLARMLCEVLMQMRAVGLSDGDACELPLTQAEIADATGMSTVHVNRTLQELRGAGLLEFDRGWLNVLNWHGLQQAGHFDPRYLHLRENETKK